jgi:hypothetical protein
MYRNTSNFFFLNMKFFSFLIYCWLMMVHTISICFLISILFNNSDPRKKSLFRSFFIIIIASKIHHTLSIHKKKLSRQFYRSTITIALISFSHTVRWPMMTFSPLSPSRLTHTIVLLLLFDVKMTILFNELWPLTTNLKYFLVL